MNDKSMVLVFDVATNGFPVYGTPSGDDSQPHMVELAARLYTEGGSLISDFVAVVRPDGWDIPAEAYAVHGIKVDYAAEYGVAEKEALDAFLIMHDQAAVRVGHGVSFDNQILRTAIKRYIDDEKADQFKAAPSECTAALTKILCSIPAAKKGTIKNPTLAQAFFRVTGETLVMPGHAERAEHNAIATARVYFAMKGVRMAEYPNDVDRLPVGVDSEGGSHD